MEVHHHPNVERKNFKEYFLEFLAVSPGFIAGSLMENISGRGKEKEYIESFIHSLKDGTTMMNHAIEENKMKIERLRDVMKFSFKNLSDQATRKLFYKRSDMIVYYSVFKSDDDTMQQLKNSGSLRLIRKMNVADSISYYDNSIKIIYEAKALSVRINSIYYKPVCNNCESKKKI